MNEEKTISTACPSLKLTYGMRALPSGHHRNVSTGTVIINITVFTVLSLLLCPPMHDALIILVLNFDGKKIINNFFYSVDSPPFAASNDPPPPYRSLRQTHGSRVNNHCSSPRDDTGQSNKRVVPTHRRRRPRGEHSPPPHAHITAWIRCMSTPCLISLPPPPLPSSFSGTHSTGHCRMHGTPTGCLGLRAHSTGRSPALCHLVYIRLSQHVPALHGPPIHWPLTLGDFGDGLYDGLALS